MPKAFEEQAIRFLRGEENPFDAFVTPEKPAHAFSQCHVAEVHAEEFERICRVIDKYRNPQYSTRRQLHETRALIVRGVRGSGKTHLLHVLARRDTETPEVWVCPRYYDPAFPFAEYLLAELVRTLLASEDADAVARLRWCARQLGRRLLAQAVASTSALEWREWTWRRRRPGWLGARSRRRGWADRRMLLDQLSDDACGSTLADICERHGLSSRAAHAMAVRHIERCEGGTSTVVRLRREVLLAFCDPAFRDDSDRLATLLQQDFTQPGAALPPARADVVNALLQTLAEVLAAIGVPIVFAFDNMERLLAHRGPVDLPTAQAFFNGLAHLIDQTRGLLVVLLAERGLWSEFGPAINTFADHRLRQGVRVRDFGCVWDLELKPPSAEQIQRVVERRVAPLLARAAGDEPLPACFPFQVEEVRAIATEGVDVLRTALLRLRDRYDELVLPAQQHASIIARQEAPAGPIEAAVLDDVLQRGWEEAAATWRRRLETTRRASLAQPLHASLGRWLELLANQEVRGWKLTEAKSAAPFGDHPTFGLVTLAGWRANDGRSCRVALGPILGEGRSMPKDLQTKLSIFLQRPSIADQLVVLWPVTEGAIDARQLPPATRQVWEQRDPERSVAICALTVPDFAWLLGFPQWLALHAEESGAEQLRRFVLDRTAYLLEDFAPRPSAEEAS
jgi:hypothetical protein